MATTTKKKQVAGGAKQVNVDKPAAGSAQTAAVLPIGRMEMLVDPADLLIDDELEKLREWTGGTEQEMSIPDLANSIYENGQFQPAIVWETAEGYQLIFGHRRRKAVMYLREQGEKMPDGSDYKLAILVDLEIKSADDALRKALRENRDRADFTVTEKIGHIALVRKRFGWEGKEGTVKVADFIGDDPATITQLERLGRASEEVQQAVSAGTLSVTAALEAVTSPPEVQAAVIAKAAEIAQAEEDKKEAKAASAAATGKKRKGNPTPTVPPMSKKPNIPKAKAKHVRAAQEQVEGALVKPKAPKSNEIADLFDTWTGPAYPRALREMAIHLSEYVHGKITSKQTTAFWDDLSDVVPDTQPQEMKAAADKPTAKTAPVKAAATAKKTPAKAPAKAPVKTTVKAPAKTSAPAKKTPAKTAPKKK